MEASEQNKHQAALAERAEQALERTTVEEDIEVDAAALVADAIMVHASAIAQLSQTIAMAIAVAQGAPDQPPDGPEEPS